MPGRPRVAFSFTVKFAIRLGASNYLEGHMSRGAERTTRSLTDQQLGQQNQLISKADQSGAQDGWLMLPTIQSLLNSRGFTPQQQTDITQQSMGAANTAFDALRQSAPNPHARQNN